MQTNMHGKGETKEKKISQVPQLEGRVEGSGGSSCSGSIGAFRRPSLANGDTQSFHSGDMRALLAWDTVQAW
jgi:hypothetical protein